MDGRSSLFADVDYGVPQSEVLSPLIFLLHIDDLPSEINFKENYILCKPKQIKKNVEKL